MSLKPIYQSSQPWALLSATDLPRPALHDPAHSFLRSRVTPTSLPGSVPQRPNFVLASTASPLLKAALDIPFWAVAVQLLTPAHSSTAIRNDVPPRQTPGVAIRKDFPTSQKLLVEVIMNCHPGNFIGSIAFRFT